MTHSFDPELARAYGLEESILIQSFVWWIRKNRADRRNFRDERWWSYSTYASIAEEHPYLTPGAIRYAIDRLVQKNVLRRVQFKKNQGDPRNWFAFEDEDRFLGKVEETAKKKAPKPPAENSSTPPVNSSTPPVNSSTCKEQLGTQLQEAVAGEAVQQQPETFGPSKTPPSGSDIQSRYDAPPSLHAETASRIVKACDNTLFEFLRYSPAMKRGRSGDNEDYEIRKVIETHLALGEKVDAEVFMRALVRAAAARFKVDGRPGMGWVVRALAEVIDEGKAPPEPKPEETKPTHRRPDNRPLWEIDPVAKAHHERMIAEGKIRA